MRPGIITLTTDFGEKDPFAGVMKGVIFGRFAGARIVDLTHQITPHQPIEAAFWLERSFSWFPAGTVHVAVVDPGVGTSRAIIAADACGHTFLAPDNGLLGPVLARDPAARIHRVDAAGLASIGVRETSATFHGRDIFSPAAAELAAERVSIDRLGPAVGAAEVVPSVLPGALGLADRVEGLVITVDRFGNLITNVRSAALAPFRAPVVEVAGCTVPVLRTYGDVQRGAYLALVGSFDVLEIARAEDDAARGLAVAVGTKISVRESG